MISTVSDIGGKRIKYVKSENCTYFEIGIDDDGSVFLRNKRTEIPNDFKMYDTEEVYQLYAQLCNEILKCKPVVHTNKDKKYIHVFFDDGNDFRYEAPASICYSIAEYSEFNGPNAIYSGEKSEYASIARLKQVCGDRKEFFSIFRQVIEDIEIGFDECEEVQISEAPEGTVKLEIVLLHGSSVINIIKINSQGYIEETGGNKYAELLKMHHVHIEMDYYCRG